MRVYAVVNEQVSDEALELFIDRQMAWAHGREQGPRRARSRGRAIRRAGRTRDLGEL